MRRAVPGRGIPCATRWALAVGLLSPGAAWSDVRAPDDVPCRHGYAFLSEPKYPPDFEHFDWVNPDAPKGGLMRVPDMGNWDNFNSMALGRMVRGMNTRGGRARHLYDSLTIRAPDEVATIYALLAECIAVPPDGAWIEFRLRDGAYWHDGETIDARDVTFSFEVYKEKANPSVAAVVVPFSRVEVPDGNRIRYHVLPEHRYDRLLPIRIGEMPVMPEHYWTAQGNDAGKATVRPPLGSGPYRIADYDIGRWIEYGRDPDYLVIMRKHVLPNATVAALTYLPFILTGAITILTFLDFLGFGLPYDAPSFGRLLSAAKANLQAPWLGITVFVALAVLLTLLIFIGEGIRDALDPRRAIGPGVDVPGGRGEGSPVQLQAGQ